MEKDDVTGRRVHCPYLQDRLAWLPKNSHVQVTVQPLLQVSGCIVPTCRIVWPVYREYSPVQVTVQPLLQVSQDSRVICLLC